jgi:hypothetical protein
MRRRCLHLKVSPALWYLSDLFDTVDSARDWTAVRRTVGSKRPLELLSHEPVEYLLSARMSAPGAFETSGRVRSGSLSGE